MSQDSGHVGVKTDVVALEGQDFGNSQHQVFDYIRAANGAFLDQVAQSIYATDSPYWLIAIIAEVPGLRLKAWDQLLVLSPSADLLHHLLSIEDVRGLAQTEIDRIITSGKKPN